MNIKIQIGVSLDYDFFQGFLSPRYIFHEGKFVQFRGLSLKLRASSGRCRKGHFFTTEKLKRTPLV